MATTAEDPWAFLGGPDWWDLLEARNGEIGDVRRPVASLTLAVAEIPALAAAARMVEAGRARSRPRCRSCGYLRARCACPRVSA